MVKNQRIIIYAIFFVFLLFTWFLSVESTSADPASKQRVYDDGKLLTKDQITKLEEKAEEYSEKRKTDFLIITTKDSNGREALGFVQDFYDNEKSGYNQEFGNTIIIGVDKKLRDVNISGFKKAEKSLNNDRIEMVLDDIYPYLKNNDYYEAFNTYLDKAFEYSGVRFGLNPDGIYFKTWFQLFIGMGIAIFYLGSKLYNIGGKVTVSGRTYNDRDATRLLDKTDRYIRTSVTRMKKPSNNSSSGGGGGGMTSGGHSHSSGSRRF